MSMEKHAMLACLVCDMGITKKKNQSGLLALHADNLCASNIPVIGLNNMFVWHQHEKAKTETNSSDDDL